MPMTHEERLELLRIAREAKAKKRQEKLQNEPPKAKGRPKNFTYAYKPSDKPFQVYVSFHKSKASSAEIKEALKAALKNIK